MTSPPLGSHFWCSSLSPCSKHIATPQPGMIAQNPDRKKVWSQFLLFSFTLNSGNEKINPESMSAKLRPTSPPKKWFKIAPFTINAEPKTNQPINWKLQKFFLTSMWYFEADLHSCNCVILDDPRVDVLHVGLDDVVIHVVDGANDAFTKSILFLYSGIVIESKEVAIFIFQEFVLLPFIEWFVELNKKV